MVAQRAFLPALGVTEHESECSAELLISSRMVVHARWRVSPSRDRAQAITGCHGPRFSLCTEPGRL